MNNRTAGIEHPDENLLAAFAGGSLTVTERNRVLFHLSTCDRCRAIVFLTQHAAAAELATVPLPHAAIAARESHHRFRWYRDQPTRWIALPTAASVLLVVLSVHWHRSSHPPFVPADKQTAIAQNQLAPRPVSPVAVTSADNAPMQPAVKATIPAQHPRRELSPTTGDTAPVKASGPDATRGAAMGGMVAGASFAARQNAPQQESPAEATQRSITPATAAPATPAMSPAHPADPLSAAQTNLDTQLARPSLPIRPLAPAPPAPPVRQGLGAASFGSRLALRSSSAATVIGETSSGAAAAPNILLPNGFRAVSVVRVAPRTIALDQDGHLFLRTETDQSWKEIAKQWSGKATALFAISAPRVIDGFTKEKQAQADNSAADLAIAPAGAHSSALRIINDAGLHYISTDLGETWHAEPPAAH